MLSVDAVLAFFRALQTRICDEIAACDGTRTFATENWRYENGTGGGITRTLEKGAVIEKGGANFSEIRGHSLPSAASKIRPALTGKPFFASGVSVVMHPRNPFAPTGHMNVRLLVADPDSPTPTWWFGGGYDLTPYYGFDEDCRAWHQHAKQICDAFTPGCYAQFKRQCDDYFYLPHRDERRGIGGIFFDDLCDPGFATVFEFVKQVGDGFVSSYRTLLNRRKHTPFTPRHRQFQRYRRGRYVEFNLVCDRGTLFGLQSGGRTESILMSLPPVATWRYNWHPAPDSEERKLTEYYLVPRDWVPDIRY